MTVKVKSGRLLRSALTKQSKNIKTALKKQIEDHAGDVLRYGLMPMRNSHNLKLIQDLEVQTERLNKAIQSAWFKEFRNSKDFRKAVTHIDRTQRRLHRVIKKLNRKRK